MGLSTWLVHYRPCCVHPIGALVLDFTIGKFFFSLLFLLFILFYFFYFLWVFLTSFNLWSFTAVWVSKSPQDSYTLQSILDNLNNVLVSMVLTLPQIFNSTNLFPKLFQVHQQLLVYLFAFFHFHSVFN